jgi:hypothetical protein
MSPSEDDIEMLCTVIQVTREVAIRSLQANGNNVDRAINDYYDDSKNVKKQVRAKCHTWVYRAS